MKGLGRFFPQAPAPGTTGDPGIFGPGSAAWRIARERAIFAGGPAALLLQLAHPLVAEGVRAHSGFATDPLQRLRGTLDAVLTVSFGDQAQVRSAAAYVARKHRPVRGTLPEPSASLPAGTPYSADHPELALWVFSTLVWSALEVTDGFLRAVPAGERDAYYQDMKRMAHLFGVPDALLPEDYTALERYVEHQVGATLDVGSTARTIAGQILAPDPPLLPLPLRPVPSVLAAGVLPPSLREAYGLPWGRREQSSFAAIRRTTRLAAPLLPARVRYWPHYAVALDRLRAASDG
ncbi:oxygenase MpaB family protein [Arthrobacter burdickii]|uniref:Oxygenase MpaB family protein n=1 Tax=Arthrobacter burdickii TaxID=3035920 RepID=A0ABT8JW52_9MICC|nr:oxygenase MpaB family protein [Arthrobacter burdickii]MDN4609375.1 oxygenase MpaB family protein [Arthrobacter burdickii]